MEEGTLESAGSDLRPGPACQEGRRTHSVFCNSLPRPCCSRTGCSAAGSAGLCGEHKAVRPRAASAQRRQAPRCCTVLARSPWPRTVQPAQALWPGKKAAAGWWWRADVSTPRRAGGGHAGESPSPLAVGAGQTAATPGLPSTMPGSSREPLRWWAEPHAPMARPTSSRDQPSKGTWSKWHRALSAWPVCSETDSCTSAASTRGSVQSLCSRCRHLRGPQSRADGHNGHLTQSSLLPSGVGQKKGRGLALAPSAPPHKRGELSR